jgi:hypothetical protein
VLVASAADEGADVEEAAPGVEGAAAGSAVPVTKPAAAVQVDEQLTKALEILKGKAA